jgi:transposase
VVQVDEIVVTKRTILDHTWSAKHHNATIDMGWLGRGAIAVLGAVSREHGIHLIMTFKDSVNVSRFKVFLEELRSRHPFDDMLLILDNLSVHKSRISRERMDELGFAYAWTPPYSPAYNGGIEETWAMGKKIIKQKRLNALIAGKQVDLYKMVHESF